MNEEQSGSQTPIAQGDTFTLRIENFANYYEVTIATGTNAPVVFTRYNHRISYDCVGSIDIYGDLSALTSVEYYVSSVSMFYQCLFFTLQWTDGSSEPEAWTEAWLELALAHHLAFLAIWAVTFIPYTLSFYFWEAVMVLPLLGMNILSIIATLVIISTLVFSSS